MLVDPVGTPHSARTLRHTVALAGLVGLLHPMTGLLAAAVVLLHSQSAAHAQAVKRHLHPFPQVAHRRSVLANQAGDAVAGLKSELHQAQVQDLWVADAAAALAGPFRQPMQHLPALLAGLAVILHSLVAVQQGALAPTALRAPDGRVVAVVVAAYQAAPRTTAAQEAQQAVVVEAARQLTGKAPVPVDSAATVCAVSGLGKGRP